jgi:Domain of unknown function (DUF4112)
MAASVGTSQPVFVHARPIPKTGQPNAHARPAPHSADTIAADLKRCRWLATWMDSRFQIGPVRFGLDAIVGLIPVAGDTLSALAGVYPIYLTYKHRLGWTPALQMVGVLFIEWLLGLPPFLGDAADIAFKGNLINAGILARALAKKQRPE